jgi:CrcB protein
MSAVNPLLVGGGSAAGALARYVLGNAVARVNTSQFPWSTWIINMAGTFLLGLFFEEFTVLRHDTDLWLVLGVGFCGGFTTFSTLSVEAVHLLRSRVILGIVYLMSSLAIGLFLAWVIQFWF